MTSSGSRGGGYHRGPMRHESLDAPRHGDEHDGWMIGYLDIMTLMVALLVLIFTLSQLGRAAEAPATAPLGPLLGVPAPSALLLARPAAPAPAPAGLSPRAISAALGVAGLPRRTALAQGTPRAAFAPPGPSRLLAQHPPPPLLAQALPLPASSMPLHSALPLQSQPQPLPQPLIARDAALPEPQAPFMLILTDRPPARVRELAPSAIQAAEALHHALSERLAEAPYLPDLEGVEVSRVAEGIKLRVEDRLLFPTAAAELTAAGETLIQRLVAVIQRHEGEVAVEGHTDSRPIQTAEFPSNWVLSSARAIAIVHALERAGVEPQRLRAVGLADTRPLAGNDSAEGRAQNRRVEVIIHAR